MEAAPSHEMFGAPVSPKVARGPYADFRVPPARKAPGVPRFSRRVTTSPVGKIRPLLLGAAPELWVWPWSNVVIIATPGDGNCLFHALLNAYNRSYRLEVSGGVATSRRDIVAAIRRDLAWRLGSPRDPLDPRSPRPYDLLSGGNMPGFAREVPEFRLENMQRRLASSAPIGYGYMEFIGDELDKDIYVFDGEKGDVYITGDEGLLHKDRGSIVLYYTEGTPGIPWEQDPGGHYELIGYRNIDGTLVTYFSPDHSFIVFIRSLFATAQTRAAARVGASHLTGDVSPVDASRPAPLSEA